MQQEILIAYESQEIYIRVQPIFTFFLFTSKLVSAQAVTIGSQEWMIKNLDVAQFRNGDGIPEIKDNKAWDEADKNKQPGWSWYDNDSAMGAKYGRLYNWYAVADPRGLCPEGWHVPSDEEWATLEINSGGREIAGQKLKATSEWFLFEEIPCANCSGWSEEYRIKVPCPNCKDSRISGQEKVYRGDGDNSSGFTGLPGGYRSFSGTFFDVGRRGKWWSCTEYSPLKSWAWACYLLCLREYSYRSDYHKADGYSVRCLRD